MFNIFRQVLMIPEFHEWKKGKRKLVMMSLLIETSFLRRLSKCERIANPYLDPENFIHTFHFTKLTLWICIAYPCVLKDLNNLKEKISKVKVDVWQFGLDFNYLGVYISGYGIDHFNLPSLSLRLILSTKIR